MKIIVINLQKKIPVNPKRIKKAALKVLSLEGIKKPGEISISFVNDRKIKELNLRYLGKNKPTDVLAFNITDAHKEARRKRCNIFADIVISTDTAIRNARIFKTTPVYELYLYIVHGLLHLSGYDDKSKKDKLIIHKREESLLKQICPFIKPKA